MQYIHEGDQGRRNTWEAKPNALISGRTTVKMKQEVHKHVTQKPGEERGKKQGDR